jgi:hypothetical protein
MKTIVTDTDDVYKNDGISVDDCLADEIEALWGIGVRTTGCCCGHGKTSGSIGVEKVDIPTMIKLGYKPLNGKVDMFFPKSKCTCKEEKKKWYKTASGYLYNVTPIQAKSMLNNVKCETDTIEEMIGVGDIVELTKPNEKRVIVLNAMDKVEEVRTMIKYMEYKLHAITPKENYDMNKRMLD